MVYDLPKLLEEGRCARLAHLVRTEPTYIPATENPSTKNIQILCSKQSLESAVAAHIQKALHGNFGMLMLIWT